MAELITRIILRNDSKDNWTTAATAAEDGLVLLKGEIGIEFDPAPVEGQQSLPVTKFKIGDGFTAWADLPYATKTSAEIEAAIQEALATAQGYANKAKAEAIEAAQQLVDNLVIPEGGRVFQKAALSEITEDKVNGDIAIITTTIADDKKSRTAYIWDATIPVYELNEDGSFKLDAENNKIIKSYGDWVAFDGNYSADNIYFDDDMMVTTAIGYISLSGGSGTIPSKGKNLPGVFEAMFVKEQNPGNPTNPSITLTLNKSGSYEAGTELTGITYSAVFNDGSYSYGPEPTGAVIEITDGKTELEMWTIKDSDNNSYSALSGDVVNPDITVIDGTNFKMTASVPHTAGNVPLTNKKKPCTDSSKQIKKGTAKGTSSSITCYRPWFYGYFDNDDINPESITSAQARALNLSDGTDKTSLPATITTKAYKQIYFAVPRDKDGNTQKTVTAVTHSVNASPAGTVKHAVVYVKGANEYVIDSDNATATNTVNGWAYDLYYISIPNANDGATWNVVTA